MIDVAWIGNRIRMLRQGAGLTQGAFAELLGVSFQAVSNWERGVAPPELETLLRIATHFEIALDDLVRPHGETSYLGVDGGGTKTEFAVVTADGTVKKRMVKGGCNPNDIGFSAMKELMEEGIRECLLGFPLLEQVFLGIAGISVGDFSERLCRELKRVFPRLRIRVRTDVFNLFATDGTADMAVVSGTGSAVFVRQAGEYRRLGGFGYLFDRAGSAYDIGREAVSLALKEEDGLCPPSLLHRKLCEKMNAASVWSRLGALYDGGKPYIAGLATVVFEAYREGDADAERIIDESAKALADLLTAGVRLYGAHPTAITGGGLFRHYPDIMIGRVGAYSDVRLVTCDLPPVYGACKTACAGMSVPDRTFYENFRETYGRLRDGYFENRAEKSEEHAL